MVIRVASSLPLLSTQEQRQNLQEYPGEGHSWCSEVWPGCLRSHQACPTKKTWHAQDWENADQYWPVSRVHHLGIGSETQKLKQYVFFIEFVMTIDNCVCNCALQSKQSNCKCLIMSLSNFHCLYNFKNSFFCGEGGTFRKCSKFKNYYPKYYLHIIRIQYYAILSAYYP